MYAGSSQSDGQCSRPMYGALLYGSEPGEVLLDLPVGDLFVVAEPLLPLHPRVVVEVVLATRSTEGRAEDVVPLELADRLEQIRRQAPEPTPGQRLERVRVQIV